MNISENEYILNVIKNLQENKLRTEEAKRLAKQTAIQEKEDKEKLFWQMLKENDLYKSAKGATPPQPELASQFENLTPEQRKIVTEGTLGEVERPATLEEAEAVRATGITEGYQWNPKEIPIIDPTTGKVVSYQRKGAKILPTPKSKKTYVYEDNNGILYDNHPQKGGKQLSLNNLEEMNNVQIIKIPKAEKFSPMQLKSVWDIDKAIITLQKLINQQEENHFEIGPTAATMTGVSRWAKNPAGNYIMDKMGTPEEAEFKRLNADYYNKYRQAITGAQASFAEIQWLSSAIVDPVIFGDEKYLYVAKSQLQELKDSRNAIFNMYPGEVQEQYFDYYKKMTKKEPLNSPESRVTGFEFNSVQEAEGAKLPKGTRVTINGREAVIE